MTIKDLIEKSIEGGYLKEKNSKLFGGFEILNGKKTSDWVIGWKNEKENCNDCKSIEQLVLDPKFWEAVITALEKEDNISFLHNTKRDWVMGKMYGLVRYLFDEQGSIEDYIKTL